VERGGKSGGQRLVPEEASDDVGIDVRLEVLLRERSVVARRSDQVGEELAGPSPEPTRNELSFRGRAEASVRLTQSTGPERTLGEQLDKEGTFFVAKSRAAVTFKVTISRLKAIHASARVARSCSDLVVTSAREVGLPCRSTLPGRREARLGFESRGPHVVAMPRGHNLIAGRDAERPTLVVGPRCLGALYTRRTIVVAGESQLGTPLERRVDTATLQLRRGCERRRCTLAPCKDKGRRKRQVQASKHTAS
jgi:hypothetical protein